MRLAVAACRLMLGARLSFYFRIIFRIILNCISYTSNAILIREASAAGPSIDATLSGHCLGPGKCSQARYVPLTWYHQQDQRWINSSQLTTYGPANNDQSLCYAGPRDRKLSSLIGPVPQLSSPVFQCLFSQSTMTDPRSIVECLQWSSRHTQRKRFAKRTMDQGSVGYTRDQTFLAVILPINYLNK